MDKRQTLTREEALGLVRRYKEVISPRFDVEPRVMMFGSYSKGYANRDSDIDARHIGTGHCLLLSHHYFLSSDDIDALGE